MDKDPSPPTPPSAETPPAPAPSRKPSTWRRVVNVVKVFVAASAVIAIVVMRGTDVLASHQYANIGTLVAGFVLLVTLLLWLAGCRSLPAWVRFGPPVAVGLFAIVFHVLFRIEGVSGELIPKYVWRFAPPRDALLDRPEQPGSATQATAPVDLLTTTEFDFPQFLGTHRDSTIDNVLLARDWDVSPPKRIWRQPIGAGWSGFAVVNGHALTMEQRGELEMVTCYNLADGQREWSHSSPVRYDSTIAGIGPRATPTVDEGRVYTLGATGLLLCLDGASGDCLWQKDIPAEFGMTAEDEAAEVSFGRANSPLIVGDLLVVPAGGTRQNGWTSLVAYDKTSGDPVWTSGDWQVAYASPVLATLGGLEQVLSVNQDFASGHNVRYGHNVWAFKWPGPSNANASVSQPVPIPPDRVFLSKGYTHGASLVRLVPRADGTFDAKELWHNSRVLRTKFTNVIVWQDHVYGLSDGILECVDLQTGDRVWKKGRYGQGQILRVGPLLLVLGELGDVSLVELSAERPNEVLGQFQAIEGKTWNTFALYGPKLLVRNAEEAACYELPLQSP